MEPNNIEVVQVSIAVLYAVIVALAGVITTMFYIILKQTKEVTAIATMSHEALVNNNSLTKENNSLMSSIRDIMLTKR